MLVVFLIVIFFLFPKGTVFADYYRCGQSPLPSSTASCGQSYSFTDTTWECRTDYRDALERETCNAVSTQSRSADCCYSTDGVAWAYTSCMAFIFEGYCRDYTDNSYNDGCYTFNDRSDFAYNEGYSIKTCCTPSSGRCGSDNGVATCSRPTADTCTRWSTAWIDTSGTDGYFDWRCRGYCGASDAYCSAQHLPDLNGVCGSAAGEIFSGGAPSSNLCLVGSVSWTDGDGNDGEYNWDCIESCNGNPVSCSAYSDTSPTLDSLIIENSDDETVTAETGRNHICQLNFKESSDPDLVNFIFNISDTGGISDIADFQMRLRSDSGQTFTSSTITTITSEIIIPIDVSALTDDTYNVEVFMNDVDDPPGHDYNRNLDSTDDWQDSGRDFKVWDCSVPVSGYIYDGSAGEVCPNFSNDLSPTANFTSLDFNSPSTGRVSEMSVSGGDSSYSDGGNELVWGTVGYLPVFNTDLAADGLSMRFIDLGVGTTNGCGWSFDLDNSVVDPYSDNPSLLADFSGIIDQEPWFQTNNGGILGRSLVSDYVPVTCSLPICSPGMAINGLVASPIISGNDDLDYSSPDNWYVESDLISDLNYYEKYKTLGVGETVNGDLDDLSGKEGVVLVNGDVNIDADNSVAVGDFLIVASNGDINISSSVEQLEGIFLGNNINISGNGDNQLVINGSLSAVNNVSIFRGFNDKSDNNSTPPVKVNLRPDLIFNMPVDINQRITSWKWGN